MDKIEKMDRLDCLEEHLEMPENHIRTDRVGGVCHIDSDGELEEIEGPGAQKYSFANIVKETFLDKNRNFKNKEKERKAFVIGAKSAGYDAGDFANISFNNKPITVAKNENGHFRGLHLVIINS